MVLTGLYKTQGGHLSVEFDKIDDNTMKLLSRAPLNLYLKERLRLSDIILNKHYYLVENNQ
jgi:hypothetical protein